MYMKNVREGYKVKKDSSSIKHREQSLRDVQFVITFYPSFSYSDSVVILERWGDFYNVQFDSANIPNMTLSLHQLDRNSLSLETDSLTSDICQSCIHNKMSPYHPYSSYPLPGVYVKSYGYGMGLIWVHYNKGQLVGVKLTG